MKEIKIIFFDIDGTLIDMDQKQISEKMLETLIRLKEKNIILCLATGRGPTCLPSFDGIEFDAFLTFNGSYCFTKQETIFSNPIPPQDIKTIIANATSINRPVSIATKDRVASNGKDKDLVDYARIANEDVHIADDFDQVAQEDVFAVHTAVILPPSLGFFDGFPFGMCIAREWDIMGKKPLKHSVSTRTNGYRHGNYEL